MWPLFVIVVLVILCFVGTAIWCAYSFKRPRQASLPPNLPPTPIETIPQIDITPVRPKLSPKEELEISVQKWAQFFGTKHKK